MVGQDCRTELWQVQLAINQSLIASGEVLQESLGTFIEASPILPTSLTDNLVNLTMALEEFSNKTLPLAINVNQRVESENEIAPCPVEDMENILEELEARNEELRRYIQEIKVLQESPGEESIDAFFIIQRIYILYSNMQEEFSSTLIPMPQEMNRELATKTTLRV